MKQIQAAPYPFDFDPATLGLIVIDMQRDFIEPGGFGASLGNDVSRLGAIVPIVQQLLEGFRRSGLTIIHTRECHRPDLSDLSLSKQNRGAADLRIGDVGPMGRLLIAGEQGAEIVPALAPKSGEIVLDKPGKGAFCRTNLEEILLDKKLQHLVLAGVTTEVCVQTTMREANDRGFDCLVATDATDSYFPAFKTATIEMITAQVGIVGWAAPTNNILEALNA